MGKQASKTVIGAFVVGAVALAVAGIVVFGSGKFFQDRIRFVMFFEGSIKGLQVGSPVLVSGGKIGEVVEIQTILDPEKLVIYNPVFIEIIPESFRLNVPASDSKWGMLQRKQHPLYEPLMKKGFKAQLVMQSFVTGQLMIGLGFFPDKPVRLVGLIKDVPEIPTVPTTLEELEKTFQKLPLKEIAGKLDNVLVGVDRLVNRLDSQVDPVASDLRDTMKAVRNSLGEADRTLASARGALAQAEKTLAFNEGVPGEVAAGILKSLAAATSALEESRKVLVQAEDATRQGAYIGYEVGKTLEEVTATSRSMRNMTDYLERHPDSLIWGKTPSKGETR